MTAAILAILGTLSVTSILAIGAKLAHDAGAAKALAAQLQKVPAVDLHTKSATFNEAVDAAGNTVEAVLKGALTADKMDAFLAFLATGPTSAQVLAWLSANVGVNLIAEVEASLPALLKQELGILGHSVPGVLGALISNAAPVVATQAAQQKLTSAQILAGLTAASQPKAA